MWNGVSRTRIQTVQEGLETKWEGSVTILSLAAKLPKKVILPPKKFCVPLAICELFSRLFF